VGGNGDSQLTLRWELGGEFAELCVDFVTLAYALRYTQVGEVRSVAL
jgi:hypothetical protein